MTDEKHTPVPPITNSLAEGQTVKQQWPIGHLEDPIHPETPETGSDDKGQSENTVAENPEKKVDEWPSVSWP